MMRRAIPILVSSGAVNERTLPNDLEGLPAVYAPAPLLPHAAIARWIERRARESVAVPGPPG
jgi:hypothetical protein